MSLELLARADIGHGVTRRHRPGRARPDRQAMADWVAASRARQGLTMDVGPEGRRRLANLLTRSITRRSRP